MSSVHGAWMNPKGESSNIQPSRLSLFLIDLFTIAISICLTLLMYASIYALEVVVATLAAVEDTNPDIYKRFNTDDDSIKPITYPQSGSPIPARYQPITRKLRTSIRHLRIQAGSWSPFRGLGIFCIYSSTRGFLGWLIRASSGSSLVEIIAQPLIGILLAPWEISLVHIIISKPSSKRFYQRIPSYRTWIKIVPPVALREISDSANDLFEKALESADWLDFDNPLNTTRETGCSLAILVFVFKAVGYFLIYNLANAIFIRVAASMLPEEDEPIVPFDRSFGGKANRSLADSNGYLTLSDAWASFHWPAQIRFAKIVFKSKAVSVTLEMVAMLVCSSSDICMALL
ncbi:hypothetical protein N7510_011433 [Penicillium lagena]|uniref:uncharacterized protein n=1 Tax=Penicillium lagena TaxID=94218 RepID=UPI00253FC9F0|nr:uncharacterized protein N7510_011433 [Penicillium lagena]KAJ5601899.1 hypothetical protein N7510_011433 [Penicillium lagena]